MPGFYCEEESLSSVWLRNGTSQNVAILADCRGWWMVLIIILVANRNHVVTKGNGDIFNIRVV